MGEALGRTLEAGQSLVAGRLELLVAEARMFIREGGAFIFVSAVAVTGWVYLMRGVTHGLSEHYPRFAVELAMGLVHVTTAMILLFRMRAR